MFFFKKVIVENSSNVKIREMIWWKSCQSLFEIYLIGHLCDLEIYTNSAIAWIVSLQKIKDMLKF